jgi:putative heme iron utilization protein
MTDNQLTRSAIEARGILCHAVTGSLATLAEGGTPFASLVTVAANADGEPILLLSDLAVHTGNLKRDRRASLLTVGPTESSDPLAGTRLTVTGTVAADQDIDTRKQFLARHPEAAGYADFADFAFYRFTIHSGHLVAGFGRIIALERSDLVGPHTKGAYTKGA